MSKITWTAPTTYTDGSPLTEPLSYTMYIDGVADASFPGSLNPDGDYFAELPLPSGDYEITLTTVVVATGQESAPSAPVQVSVPFVPSAPTGLRVDV